MPPGKHYDQWWWAHSKINYLWLEQWHPGISPWSFLEITLWSAGGEPAVWCYDWNAHQAQYSSWTIDTIFHDFSTIGSLLEPKLPNWSQAQKARPWIQTAYLWSQKVTGHMLECNHTPGSSLTIGSFHFVPHWCIVLHRVFCSHLQGRCRTCQTKWLFPY